MGFQLPLLACAAPVSEPVTLQSYVSYATAVEDNVLGLPNDDVAEQVTGRRDRGDRSHTVRTGVLFDKTVSQQHLAGKIGISDTRYDVFSKLNYQGRDVAVQWSWRIGPNVAGDLNASYIRSLTPFTDFHQLESNLRTQRQRGGSVRWRLHPSWQLRTAIDFSSTDYSLLAQQANSQRYNSTEIGADYLAKSGSTFGIVARRGDGEYRSPVRFPRTNFSNNYKQDEFKARVNWIVSAKTRIEFLGGGVSRNYENLTFRNYTGFNAKMSANWQATSKLGLTAAFWSELGGTDDITTVYALNKGTSMTAQFVVTEKISSELQLRHETREFKRSADFAQLPSYGDALRTAALTSIYSPTNKFSMRVMVYYNDKSSKINSNFERRGVSGSAEYRF